jgi:hypothetical protein
MQGAPIFGKVELLIKEQNGITKKEWHDSGLVITGDYLIVVVNEKDDIETTNTTTGLIYHMSEVESYKTHQK